MSKKMDFHTLFISHRRASLDFAQKLLNSCSPRTCKLKKRTASLLVVSELDALASFIYGHNESKKAFIDLLCEWSENEVFSAIWTKKLVDFFEDNSGHSYREVLKKAATHIQNLTQQKFQNKDEYNSEKQKIIESLSGSDLDDNQCEILRDILWRISDENGINSNYLEQYKVALKNKKGRRRYYQYAKPFFEQLGNSEFLKRETIQQKLCVFLEKQRYDQKTSDNTMKLVVDNLHHGSYAACVYKFRCDCTHRFDAPAQSFSNVTYDGKPIECINFDLLQKTYDQILRKLENIPTEEFKKIEDQHKKSQEGMSGVLPLLNSLIYALFKN